MPQQITNPKILDVLRKNKVTMEKLFESNSILDKRLNNLEKQKIKFINYMNEEYGLGGWQNVNAADETFIPKEEFMDQYYVIHNPALREQVKLDDVELKINNGDENGENNETSGVQSGASEDREVGLLEESGGSDAGQCDSQSQSCG